MKQTNKTNKQKNIKSIIYYYLLFITLYSLMKMSRMISMNFIHWFVYHIETPSPLPPPLAHLPNTSLSVLEPAFINNFWFQVNDLFGFIDEKGDLGEGPSAFAVCIYQPFACYEMHQKMSSAGVICCMQILTGRTNFSIQAYSVDPD